MTNNLTKHIREFGFLALLNLLLSQAPPLSAAIRTWDGSANGNWSAGANWTGNVAPVDGDSVAFPLSAARYTITNDIAGLEVDSISFEGSNYVIYGAAASPGIQLSGGITANNVRGSNSLHFNITNSAPQTFSCTWSTASLNLGGTSLLLGANLLTLSGAGHTWIGSQITGTAGLTKSGGGTLTLYGASDNTFTGPTTVTAGTLELNKAANANAFAGVLTNSATVRHLQNFQIPTVPIVLLSGSLLDLNDKNDTIGSLTLDGAMVDTGTGTLTLGGNVTNLAGTVDSTIRGQLSLGSVSRIFNVLDDVSSASALHIYASMAGTGSAGITKQGWSGLYLRGTNTYPGTTYITQGKVLAYSDAAFGSTAAGVQVGEYGSLYLNGVDIGAEPLAIIGGDSIALYGMGTSSWSGLVTLTNALRFVCFDSASITFSNAIGGPGSLTLEGDIFEFAGTNANTYAGATHAKCLELRLNKTGSGTNSVAVPADLIIGGLDTSLSGTGPSNVVRLRASQQIANTADITFHTNGVLNGNGYSDTFGSLTFNGGRVDNSGGIFYLNTGAGITVNPTNVTATINGTLSLFSGTHTFYVGAGSASPDLRLNADITGSGSITFTGDGGVYLLGDNTYSGATTLNGPPVWAYSDTALGSTNGATVVNSNSSYLYLAGADIGNETLTINRVPGAYSALYASGNSSWSGPIILNSDARFYAYNTLILSNAISGAGGLTLSGDTCEFAGSAANTYAGATTVNCEFLRLNHAAGINAIPGDLVIGGTGTGASNVVLLLQCCQMPITTDVTLHTNGVLHLNNFNESLGGLNFTGGRVDTGTGLLTLNNNVTVNSSPFHSFITGQLSLGTGTRTFDMIDDQVNPPLLTIKADISGAAAWRITGWGTLHLEGDNTYTGTTTIDGPRLSCTSDTGLGTTAGGTVVDSGNLHIQDVIIGKEQLTLNTSEGFPFYSAGDSVWGGVVIVNTNVSMISIGGTLVLSNDIRGVGGVRLVGDNFEYAGAGTNTYTGTTTVYCAFLRLNHDYSGPNYAVSGPLSIGGGFLEFGESNVVLCLDSFQLPVNSVVTFQTNGWFDGGGFNQRCGSLVFNGGRVETRAAALTVYGNVTVNSNDFAATMNGRVALVASPASLNVANGPQVRDLVVNARIEQGIINKSGAGTVYLPSSNSFTGVLNVNEGRVFADHDYALGRTDGQTVVAAGAVLEVGVTANQVSEPITLNGHGPDALGAFKIQGTCAFHSNLVLNTDTTINLLGTSGDLVTFDGVVSGAGGFTKLGVAPLQLSGPAGNTYLGDTFLNQGRLELGKTTGTGAAIRYGRLTIGDGTGGADADVVRYLADGQLWSSVPVTITSSGLLDLNGFVDTVGALAFTGGRATSGAGGEMRLQGTVVATNGSGTLQGNATLSGTRTFDVANTRALYLEANVSGTGGLTKTSRGLLYVSGSNSYSGLTLINGGAVYLEHNFALGTTNSGTTVGSGASLYLRNGVSIGLEPLTVSGDGVSGFAAGAFNSTGGSNAWAGPITLAGDTRISVGSGSVTTDWLNLSGAIDGAGDLTKDFLGTLQFSGSSANSYNGSTHVNSGTLELSKSVNNGSIPGNLYIGDGVGGTDADVVRALGTFQIGNAGNVVLTDSGLLDISGLNFDDGLGSLAGNGHVELGTKILGVGMNGSNTEYSGRITGGVGRFVKMGEGTMTLSGTNTYSGPTEIQAGILLVNGSQPASPVEVLAGTLGGNGVVGNIFSSDLVSPGTSPGTLTSSNVAFNGSSIFAVELTGTGSDQLKVRGTNNLGSATLSLTTSGLSLVEGQTFIIINNDGTDPIVGTFAGLAEGSLISAGAQQFRISYTGGTGNDVTLTFTNTAIQAASATISSGNGNGVVDANECDLLSVVLTNTSAYMLSDVIATLTPVTPGVAVTYPVTVYPNVVPHGRGTNTETFQFATWPGFVGSCGANVQMNLTIQSASHGTFTLPVSLPSGSPDTAFSYSNLNPYGIPDSSSVTSSIPVATFGGTLAKVTVSLFATHGFDADLDMYLIGPDGTIVELTSDNGGAGNSYGSACTPSTSRTTFDDSGLVSITAGTAPFSGTYRPEGSLSAFRGKSGAAVNGAWRLVITDDLANGQFGALNCWYLTLYNAVCTDGGGVCESCPDRVIQGALSTGSLNQNGRLTRDGVPSVCGTLKSYPGNFASGSGRYCDYYTFINGESNACIQVSLTSDTGLFSAAYLHAYNPASLGENYLADMGSSTDSGGSTYSFNVAAGAVFVVVVNQVDITDTGNYTLSVTGGSCRPRLDIAQAGANRVAIGWSTAGIGYQLMQTNTLGVPPSQPWTPVGSEPVVFGSKFTVTNHTILFGPQRFYELRKP